MLSPAKFPASAPTFPLIDPTLAIEFSLDGASPTSLALSSSIVPDCCCIAAMRAAMPDSGASVTVTERFLAGGGVVREDSLRHGDRLPLGVPVGDCAPRDDEGFVYGLYGAVRGGAGRGRPAHHAGDHLAPEH